MATPETQVNQQANEFAAFSVAEVTAEEKGPSLPDSVVHALPVPANKIADVLTAAGITSDAVKQAFASAVEGRPAGFLVLGFYPIPKANEIDRRKARNVYGFSSGTDLPLADSDNNRLKFTSLVYAQVKKDEDSDGSASGDAEKELASKE